ncbi:MAG: hypothetical protein AB7H90_01185 [Alphaproteobacteria bacterium]
MTRILPELPPSHLGYDEETMLLCAFRYCLGRMTYVVGDCQRWIRDRWDRLSPGMREVILRDLREALQRDAQGRQSIGMDMDRRMWTRLLEDLEDAHSP